MQEVCLFICEIWYKIAKEEKKGGKGGEEGKEELGEGLLIFWFFFWGGQGESRCVCALSQVHISQKHIERVIISTFKKGKSNSVRNQVSVITRRKWSPPLDSNGCPQVSESQRVFWGGGERVCGVVRVIVLSVYDLDTPSITNQSQTHIRA